MLSYMTLWGEGVRQHCLSSLKTHHMWQCAFLLYKELYLQVEWLECFNVTCTCILS